MSWSGKIRPFFLVWKRLRFSADKSLLFLKVFFINRLDSLWKPISNKLFGLFKICTANADFVMRTHNFISVSYKVSLLLSHSQWSLICYSLCHHCLLESLSSFCWRLKRCKCSCKSSDALDGFSLGLPSSSWNWCGNSRRMLWTESNLRMNLLSISCSIHINVLLQLCWINL